MGDWTENKYVETRFGGMDASHEPHTLDRDSGMMAEIFNMSSRSQGLRSRSGYMFYSGISMDYSPRPGAKKTAIGIIPYDVNIEIEAVGGDDDDDDEDDDDNGGVGVVIPTDTGDGSHGHIPRDPNEEGDNQEDQEDDDPVVDGGFEVTIPASVVNDVPFNIEVIRTGTGSYRGSDCLINGTMLPGGVSAPLSIRPGATIGWTNKAWHGTGTVACRDRRKTEVVIRAKRSSTDEGSESAIYSVGDMIPRIEDVNVEIGETFPYRIDYKFLGSVQSGYVGNGRGLTVRFEGVDANGVKGSVNVKKMTGSWNGGTFSGTAKLIDAGTSVVKLRLVAEYAGNTEYHEVNLDQHLELTVPAMLHIYGGTGDVTVAVN